jgi:hypothetical protein
MFRLFRRWEGRQRSHVVDRYFYDNLVHYELRTPTERLCAALLRYLVPVPDVAILLVASPETIAARRLDYAAEYITHVNQAYGGLRDWFPDLIEISTDPDEPSLERVEAVVRERLTTKTPGLRGRWVFGRRQ